MRDICSLHAAKAAMRLGCPKTADEIYRERYEGSAQIVHILWTALFEMTSAQFVAFFKEVRDPVAALAAADIINDNRNEPSLRTCARMMARDVIDIVIETCSERSLEYARLRVRAVSAELKDMWRAQRLRKFGAEHENDLIMHVVQYGSRYQIEAVCDRPRLLALPVGWALLRRLTRSEGMAPVMR